MRTDRVRRWSVVAAIVLALAASATAYRATSARALPRDSWHLDIGRALDLLGIHAGMVVGEAGAGDGYFTLPLAERVGPRGAVYANDISRRSLDSLASKARADRLENVHVVEGSVDDARFPRRDLEMVVIVHAFHDFGRPVDWLVNTRKYLRPGGAVAIIDLDPGKGASSHFLSRDRILEHARAAGYDLVRVFDNIPEYQIVVLTPRP